MGGREGRGASLIHSFIHSFIHTYIHYPTDLSAVLLSALLPEGEVEEGGGGGGDRGRASILSPLAAPMLDFLDWFRALSSSSSSSSSKGRTSISTPTLSLRDLLTWAGFIHTMTSPTHRTSHPPTRPLTHLPTYPCIDIRTHSSIHSFAHQPTHPPHQVTLSPPQPPSCTGLSSFSSMAWASASPPPPPPPPR